MKEEKTIREWLETLPAPYAQQAIENATLFDSLYLDSYKTDSFQKALVLAFNWHNTTQGDQYWVDVANGKFPITTAHPKVKEFHCVWYISDEKGLKLTSGENVKAHSMLEALAAFIEKYDVEPIYIIEK